MLIDDEHNRRLRALVDTRTKALAPKHDAYDLIAIGGGTAGLVATAGMGVLGARVALVERELLGGDCLVTGCVPSKALIHGARIAHSARGAGRWGINAGEVTVDFAKVMDRVRETRSEIADDDSVATAIKRDVDVIHGTARFVGPRAVEVDGRRLEFRRALIATGSRPRLPEIPGLEAIDPLTNESLFELRALPKRIAVIGGGPIGCEMAQALQRLGAQVTLLQRGERLLPRDDPEASELVRKVFTDEGIDVRCNANVTGARATAETCELDVGDEVVRADRVLVATGRLPNVEGLGLDVAGVEFDDRGVKVSRHFRSSSRRIYAAGDVASGPQFTHAAWAQAEYAVLNAFFPVWLDVAARVMPHATYTDPEVAHVGAAFEELANQETDTLRLPMAHNDRAHIEGEEHGFAKIHLKKGTDKIVAATIVGRHAGDMIGQCCLAMTRGLGVSKLVSTIVPYPTRSELVRDLAYEHATRNISPWMKRLAKWWIRRL